MDSQDSGVSSSSRPSWLVLGDLVFDVYGPDVGLLVYVMLLVDALRGASDAQAASDDL